MSRFIDYFKDLVASDTHVSSTGGKKRPATIDPNTKLPVTKPTAAAEAIEEGDVAKYASVLKVDDELGLVFGWAIVCKRDGADYWDLQNDHIPEDSMLSASLDFALSGAYAKEMHAGDVNGSVAFLFPMTAEIAKAFSIETTTTGLMIAMRPGTPDMLAKFRPGPNGEPPVYTGFSIGGSRIKDEEVG